MLENKPSGIVSFGHIWALSELTRTVRSGVIGGKGLIELATLVTIYDHESCPD